MIARPITKIFMLTSEVIIMIIKKKGRSGRRKG